ncbi:hypothetical protein Pd630_LPD13051 (plasmid) [Rhodococcus opacus PD630]|nr:hypothetical protein Pd630_LPD13051 [Rhodococcus opacus PD630]
MCDEFKEPATHHHHHRRHHRHPHPCSAPMADAGLPGKKNGQGFYSDD